MCKEAGELGGFSSINGKCQAFQDSLLGVIKFFNLDIPVDFKPLPEDFDIKKHIRKPK